MGGGKGRKPKQQQKKGKGGKRVSGNPAKAAQEKEAAKEKAAAGGNPFGNPGAEPVDYEKAAAELNLPKDFSKFLK